MNILKKMLLYALGIAILGYAAGVGLVYLSSTTKTFSMDMLTNSTALICMGCGALLGAVLALTGKNESSAPKAKTKAKTAKGEEYSLHFDAKFLSRDEIFKTHGLINTTWNQLPSIKNTGLVVRNCIEGKNLEVTMKDEVHVLVIGTTGSGKTSLVLEPSLRILAHTGEKPSFVISDPKGELYEKHAAILKKEGYNVVVYDLDNAYGSAKWNPMERAFLTYQRAMNIYKEAKQYSNVTPQAAGKKTVPGMEYGNLWFELDGVAFPSKELLEEQLASKKQQLINEAMQDLRGIALSLCPVSQGTNDSSWEQGAQDYLYGIMVAMLEDSCDERLGDDKLRLDQFNFYNLYRIANKRDADPDNPFGSIKKYVNGRLKTSEVKGLCSPVIDNSPGTTKSYLGVLAGKISQLMGDMGICYATSSTEIDFSTMSERPTAFFIKIPDHKKERHPLATICIAQLYRALVDKANTYPGNKLPRHVYFFLDEFGNLPVIPDFATMVTVSRSRNVFFEIVVQSYTQLDTKYGKEISETLRGNFNAVVFLGTEDQKTKDEFSKSCGEVQLILEEKNVTKNKNPDGKDSSSESTSIQRPTKPLIDSYELGLIEFGTAIVKLFRVNPMKLKLCQFHRTEQFEKEVTKLGTVISKSLNTEKVFFDIDKRNSIIFTRSSRPEA